MSARLPYRLCGVAAARWPRRRSISDAAPSGRVFDLKTPQPAPYPRHAAALANRTERKAPIYEAVFRRVLRLVPGTNGTKAPAIAEESCSLQAKRPQWGGTKLGTRCECDYGASYFPHSATPVVCAVSARRLRVPDPIQLSKPGALRRTSDRSRDRDLLSAPRVARPLPCRLRGRLVRQRKSSRADSKSCTTLLDPFKPRAGRGGGRCRPARWVRSSMRCVVVWWGCGEAGRCW